MMKTKVLITTVFAFLLSSTLATSSNVDKGKELSFGKSEQYRDIIIQVASEYHIEPILIASIINHESGGKWWAIGSVKEIGMMQLRPEFHSPNCRPCLFDPEYNIRLGTKYFVQILKMKGGNVNIALSAYNTGPYTKWVNHKYINAVTEEYKTIMETKYAINKSRNGNRSNGTLALR